MKRVLLVISIAAMAGCSKEKSVYDIEYQPVGRSEAARIMKSMEGSWRITHFKIVSPGFLSKQKATQLKRIMRIKVIDGKIETNVNIDLFAASFLKGNTTKCEPTKIETAQLPIGTFIYSSYNSDEKRYGFEGKYAMGNNILSIKTDCPPPFHSFIFPVTTERYNVFAIPLTDDNYFWFERISESKDAKLRR